MQNAQLKNDSSSELELDFNNTDLKINNIQKKGSNGTANFNTNNLTPDAIIFANENGEVRYMNSEAQNLTGWFITDAMNKKSEEVFKIYSIENKDRMHDPITEVLENNSKIDLTDNILLKSKDNLYFEIQYKASPKYKQDGELNKIILTFKKIREIDNISPKENVPNHKVEAGNVASKPKGISIDELSFNDIENDLIIKTETSKNDKAQNVKNDFSVEKEISLKVVNNDNDDNTELAQTTKDDSHDIKTPQSKDFNYGDEALSIDLGLDENIQNNNVSSTLDSIDYNTKTVKKIDSDTSASTNKVYKISSEELDGLETLDFLKD